MTKPVPAGHTTAFDALPVHRRSRLLNPMLIAMVQPPQHQPVDGSTGALQVREDNVTDL
jgi:hypothetical protein